MKCPDCNFNCSDLRDICPKCFVDLRPFKGEIGIPVTHAKATYEQLLAKLGIQGAEEPELVQSPGAPPVATPASLGSVIKRIFRGLKGAKSPVDVNIFSPELPPERDAELSPQVDSLEEVIGSLDTELLTEAIPEAADHTTQESPSSADLPASIDLSVPEESPPLTETGAFSDMVDPPPVLDPQPESQSPLTHSFLDNEVPAPSDDTTEVAPMEAFTSGEGSSPNEGIEAPDAGPAAIDSSPFDEQLPIREHPPLSEQLTREIVTSEHSYRFTSWPSLTARPRPPAEGAENEGSAVPGISFSIPDRSFSVLSVEQETELAFADALKDLLNDPYSHEVELSSEHFFRVDGRGEVEVLFEMARESLMDPESEKRYVDLIESSVNRKVEAETSSARLREFEQIVNAPMLSLKGVPPLGLSGFRTQTVDSEHITPTAGSPVRRLLAFLIDGLIVFAAAGVSSVSVLLGTSGELNEFLIGSRAINAFDLIDFALLTSIFSIMFWFLIPFVSLVRSSSTPGLSLSGLSVRSLRGRRLGIAQSLVWSLSFPLSLIAGSFLMPLVGRATLHEWACRGVVAKSI